MEARLPSIGRREAASLGERQPRWCRARARHGRAAPGAHPEDHQPGNDHDHADPERPAQTAPV